MPETVDESEPLDECWSSDESASGGAASSASTVRTSSGCTRSRGACRASVSSVRPRMVSHDGEMYSITPLGSTTTVSVPVALEHANERALQRGLRLERRVALAHEVDLGLDRRAQPDDGDDGAAHGHGRVHGLVLRVDHAVAVDDAVARAPRRREHALDVRDLRGVADDLRVLAAEHVGLG